MKRSAWILARALTVREYCFAAAVSLLVSVGACAPTPGAQTGLWPEQPSIQGPGPLTVPTPDEIKEAANETDKYLTDLAASGTRRARSLERQANIGTWIGRVSKWLGGAGAVIFGLDGQGDEAAVAGGLVALGALIEELINPPKKRQLATECYGLGKLELTVKRETTLWELLANDEDFQAIFSDKYNALWDTVNPELQKCDASAIVP